MATSDAWRDALMGMKRQLPSLLVIRGGGGGGGGGGCDIVENRHAAIPVRLCAAVRPALRRGTIDWAQSPPEGFHQQPVGLPREGLRICINHNPSAFGTAQCLGSRGRSSKSNQQPATSNQQPATSSMQQHAAARSSMQQHVAARSSTQQHAAARSSTQHTVASSSKRNPRQWLYRRPGSTERWEAGQRPD